jgi:hypothetical protein
MDPLLLITTTLFCSLVIVICLAVITGRAQTPIGQLILQAMKSQHPNNAYIIISGTGATAREILEKEENYRFDTRFPQNNLNLNSLDRGIQRIRNRVQPLPGKIDKRRQVLEETLERYKEIYAIYLNNLSVVEEKKAQMGLEVSVKIENQIKLYQRLSQEARAKLREIETELKSLDE